MNCRVLLKRLLLGLTLLPLGCNARPDVGRRNDPTARQTASEIAVSSSSAAASSVASSTSIARPESAPEVQAQPPAPQTADSSTRLQFIERTTGGGSAEEPLAWIVAFHGLGDNPEAFSHLFDHVPFKAHVYLPRAPLPYGSGFDWFGVRVRGDPAQLAQAIEARLPAIRTLLSDLATRPSNRGDALVTGFSQGGVLSYAVATAHLPHVRATLPIAGALPIGFVNQIPLVPVIAFHGEADRVVPFSDTQRFVESWQPRAQVVLHSYPRVGHSINGALWNDWAQALQAALQP